QSHHMLHVPFENLAVIRNVPIILDVDDFYEKVVTRHRGGYCYELNGLYYALLKRLGFSCKLVSATVQKPDGTWARKGSHACTIADIDGEAYLTDVGFGDSATISVPFNGEMRKDVSGAYRLEYVAPNVYDLKWKYSSDDEWSTRLRIDTHPKDLQDFTEACKFNQTSPESPFTQKDVVTLATANGRITLSGNTLTTTYNGKKEQKTIRNEDKTAVLKTHFEININGRVVQSEVQELPNICNIIRWGSFEHTNRTGGE